MLVTSVEADNTVAGNMALAAMRLVVAKQAEFNEAIQERSEREVAVEISERVDELVEEAGEGAFSSSNAEPAPSPSEDRGANLDIEV
ncbi:MAG TPA: hypothetical protein QF509_02725 [Rhodospirillales bacterium]|jgi:hypothetical protein|nr:hypothetical protein [Rhodospirillales bacterium]